MVDLAISHLNVWMILSGNRSARNDRLHQNQRVASQLPSGNPRKGNTFCFKPKQDLANLWPRDYVKSVLAIAKAQSNFH
jgi:hypothetical protein